MFTNKKEWAPKAMGGLCLVKDSNGSQKNESLFIFTKKLIKIAQIIIFSLIVRNCNLNRKTRG